MIVVHAQMISLAGTLTANGAIGTIGLDGAEGGFGGDGGTVLNVFTSGPTPRTMRTSPSTNSR